MTTTVYTINRAAINQAITAAHAKATSDQQHERITHAATWLAKFPSGRWTLHTDFILVKSEHDARLYRVFISTGACSCPSTCGCWHQALSWIVCRAAQLVAPPVAGSGDLDFAHDTDRVYAITAAANAVLFA